MQVEPTESEDKQELDRFVDALIGIRKEIDAVASGKYHPTVRPVAVRLPCTALHCIALHLALTFANGLFLCFSTHPLFTRSFPPVTLGRLPASYWCQNNPLKNAPHTARVIISEEWNRPYTREEAAYPAPWYAPVPLRSCRLRNRYAWHSTPALMSTVGVVLRTCRPG